MSAELFQTLERVVREIRITKNIRAPGPVPFGGLQLILCGDFFQLPPIEKRWSPNLPKDAFLNRGFAFQAPAWNKCGLRNIQLTKVFRQADEEFVSVLNNLREGRAANAFQLLSQRCMRPLTWDSGVKPTELFARNKDVDEVNARELGRIQCSEGEETFVRVDTVVTEAEKAAGSGDGVLNWANHSKQRNELMRHEFFRDCLAAERVTLKKGAQARNDWG